MLRCSTRGGRSVVGVDSMGDNDGQHACASRARTRQQTRDRTHNGETKTEPTINIVGYKPNDRPGFVPSTHPCGGRACCLPHMLGDIDERRRGRRKMAVVFYLWVIVFY
jgi:hypothetical protein